MFAPAAPAPLSYGPVQKYRYACCGTSAAPRSTRDAHVAEPRIAMACGPEASTDAPHPAQRPFLDGYLVRELGAVVGLPGPDQLARALEVVGAVDGQRRHEAVPVEV